MATRFTLFGPIAFYDVVRTARRGRYILVRYVYLCILLLLICFLNDPWHAPSRNAARLAEFGTALFTTFIVTQLAAVLLLTPSYVATALTEEKEGKTLEFLLATDLLSREIVLGKLAARLGNMALLVLAGLPVLSLLELLGGIDPNLVLAGFAVTALTMLGLGSVSMLCSVYCRRSMQVLVLIYLIVFIYLSLSAGVWGAVTQAGATSMPLGGGSTLGILADWVAGGNLPILLVRLRMSWTGAGTQLGAFVLRFAVFQMLLAIFCVTWSVVRLRVVARREASGPTRVEHNDAAGRALPPLGQRPVLWKELYTPSAGRSSRTTRYLLGTVIAIGVGVWIAAILRQVMEIFGQGLDRFLMAPEMTAVPRLPWPSFVDQMTWAIAAPAAGVAGTLFLGLAAHAAGTVTGERTRQTLEGLLTTPLPTQAILGDKVLGCLLGTRGAWWGHGTEGDPRGAIPTAGVRLARPDGIHLFHQRTGRSSRVPGDCRLGACGHSASAPRIGEPHRPVAPRSAADHRDRPREPSGQECVFSKSLRPGANPNNHRGRKWRRAKRSTPIIGRPGSSVRAGRFL